MRSSKKVSIHPTVIMSISEHHTRVRAISRSTKTPQTVVIGALLGNKSGHNIEIVDSFELRFADCYTVDREFYQKKIPLVKQVHDLEIIGWYSNTSTKEVNISIHKQISELIPNPIFLKLDPNRRETDPKISGSLPLQVFEPVIEIESGCENLYFFEIGWTIVTEDVEIIGLEHNARMTYINVAPSAAIDNLRLQYSAVKMLKDRIKVLSKYVKDVQSGLLPYHEDTIKDIDKLSRKFPLMNSDQYTHAYNVQCNDVALNTYLGILTKGSMLKMHFGLPSSKLRAYPSTHARR